MPRMIDLIRQSAVPANVMRNASRGVLTLPPQEVLEILVYLTQHPFFAEQAKLTLAGFDEQSAINAAQNPDTPNDVLNYLSAPANLRPALLPALLSNPRVSDQRIAELCAAASPVTVQPLLTSERVRRSYPALEALTKNHRIGTDHVAEAEELLKECEPEPTAGDDAAVAEFMAEHAKEIAAEEGKPYVLTGASDQEQQTLTKGTEEKTELVGFAKRADNYERPSVVQKIARMNVGERVQLAMKGNRDERFILIRDGARIVANAVLESPKITDAELDSFAAMKNVGDNVLRILGTKRKFVKRYATLRILVNNPKTPIDISLQLLPHLTTNDLKNLTKNRDVSDTIAKIARKMYRDRTMAR
jgi:hypothetical protein